MMFETIGDIVMKRMRFIPGVFAMMLMLAGDSCFARGMAGGDNIDITVADGVVNGLELPLGIARVTFKADGSKSILAVGATGGVQEIIVSGSGKVLTRASVAGLRYEKKDYYTLLGRRKEADFALKKGINYDAASLKFKAMKNPG